jgi:hypothetical protein
MEILEKVKQAVRIAARNVSGTPAEAPIVESDTRSPEAIRATEEHQRVNDRGGLVGKPSHLDLEIEFENIEDQIRYWSGVREDARVKAAQSEAKLPFANEILADVGENPKGNRAKDDKRRAEATIAKETRWAEIQKKRIANAEAQLRVWSVRAQEFPKGELTRLRYEESRRRRLSKLAF